MKVIVNLGSLTVKDVTVEIEGSDELVDSIRSALIARAGVEEEDEDEEVPKSVTSENVIAFGFTSVDPAFPIFEWEEE
jgi:hypothetical protein